MASSAQINAKVEAAIAASEAGDFESAVVRLREAMVLIATTPDREFDNQKVSWREGDLQALLQTYERAAAAKRSGGFKNIPIVSATRRRLGG